MKLCCLEAAFLFFCFFSFECLMKAAESGWMLMSCRCEINDKRQEGEEVDGVRKSFLNRRETVME